MIASEKLFEIRRQGDVVVATPTANLRELEYQRILRDSEEVLAFIRNGDARNVVLDLRSTDYCGSTALELFTTLWTQVRDHGGQMVLCNLSDHELEILEATHLDRLWPILPTLDEALRAVGADAAADDASR